MIAFIPIDFITMQKEKEEAENYAKGTKGNQSFLYKKYTPPATKDKKDKKKEEEEKSAFEEIKELIYDPVMGSNQENDEGDQGERLPRKDSKDSINEYDA